MSEIHPISPRNAVPVIVPVLEVQPVHAHTASESEQAIITAQTIISKSLTMPVLTSSLLSQALESLHREFSRLPGNTAEPILEILKRMQSPQTSMADRTQFFSVSNNAASLFAMLKEFISISGGNPVMNPANTTAVQMVMLMERQLVINLHALAAGLPIKVFFPVPNQNPPEVAEFTYDNANKTNNHLRHFSLKMDTKTMGEVSVAGAELDKRLNVGFHTHQLDSVRRLMDNFPHLRTALESMQFTITGLTATQKPQKLSNVEPHPTISVTA